MLYRCGEGYAWTWLALRFPRDEEVVVDALAVGTAASRFLSESFFSLCSRCNGGGAGVLDAGREGAGDATACADEAFFARNEALFVINEVFFVMSSLSGWGAIAG